MTTQVEKLKDIDDELTEQGTTADNIQLELADHTVILNTMSTEQADQGTTLDGIETNQTDGSQKTQITDASGNITTIDDTGTLVSIEFEHHEIHEGDHYFISNFESVDEDGNIDFVVISPDTTDEIHMTWRVDGTSQTEFRIYESSTVSDDGTLTTPINNNRRSANTSVTTVRKNPTSGS